MLEDDPLENPEPVSSKKKNKEAIAYDDVYTRKEISDKQSTSIQKMRQLQENELQCIMDQGTYVQCCDCKKWRSGVASLFVLSYLLAGWSRNLKIRLLFLNIGSAA